MILGLSHPLREGIPCWPGDPPYAAEVVAEPAQDGYLLRRILLGEHTGTHVNTPGTFFPGGKSTADYPAAHWVRPGLCIRFTPGNPDERFATDQLLAWETLNGRVPPGTVVLLDTGWERFWNDPERYLGIDDAGTPHFPGFDPECARVLVEERRVAGLGIDTHGVDGGNDPEFRVNRLVLGRDGIVLECLAGLGALPEGLFTLIIGALPLEGGSGAPAAVLAFVGDPVG